ncbi:NTP transferase domain-containing protein [Candidatus Peregrinibacteria bacterium]|nr:NTP transferase domain-containing protein [Candidatus Peregrinibacteria bacterium]
MKTLLLLAGRSRRFWPLTEKTLFPIAGKTLLGQQMETLKAGGCKDIILVAGEHNLKAAHKMYPSLKIIEQEDLEGGMQAALLSALPSLRKEQVLILGGNDVIEPKALKELQKAAERPDAMGAILAKKVRSYFPGGYLVTKAGRVLGVKEKPGAGNEPSDLVNIVAHIHNDASVLLKALEKVKSKKDDGYEVALTALMEEHVYRVVPYNGLWQPVKYPWHLLELLPIFLSSLQKSSPAPRSPARAGEGGIAKSASIHKSAVIDGSVVIGEHVKVLPHASIVGPCVVGDGTVIGTGALVRGSSIGKRCVIGFGSEVKDSIVSDDVWTHMTYLGDSIVGNNVAFGGRATTGNFRLDEGEIFSASRKERIGTGRTKLGAVVGEGSRIGICVGLNPGIKIGQKSFISGGIYVTDDVPDGSFVSMKDGTMTVRPNRVEAVDAADREKYRM